jgi:hypothetical protein
MGNKNPGREFGQENPNRYWKASTFQNKFLTGDRATTYSAYSGLPYGYDNPASFVLPQKAGAMASRQTASGTVSSAQGQNGYPITSTLAGVGTISDAAGGLIVEMLATIAASGGLTATITGQLQALATIAGSGDLTASIGALAGLTASIASSSVISFADEVALGEMMTNIYVNEGAATVDQIVQGVIDNMGSVTATVPNMLNTETGDIIIPLD